ncbi:MAG TPA: hypothetical protein VG184_11915 [Acidimicrobiales bacterium]|jgi:hypothetical protein|nr:hypothetical protein [Acidimicrobiales bacterium]
MNTKTVAAAGLLGASVVVGVVALFPAYLAGAPVTAQVDQLVLDSLLLAGWALAVALLLARHPGAGAGLATGVTVAAVGLRLADVGAVIHGGASLAGAGLWLTVAGWFLAAAGAVTAVMAGAKRAVGGPTCHPWPVAILAGAASTLTAVAFVPGWDAYHIVIASQSRTVTQTLGNAFSSPWPVTAGNAVVVAAIGLVPVIAVLWRPRVFGTALLGGLLVMLVGQVASALALTDQAVSAAQLGIGAAQATQLGVHVHTVLNGWFAAEVEGTFALLAVWVARWLLPDRKPPVAAPAPTGGISPAGWLEETPVQWSDAPSSAATARKASW